MGLTGVFLILNQPETLADSFNSYIPYSQLSEPVGDEQLYS
jgi:hypothetical protein